MAEPRNYRDLEIERLVAEDPESTSTAYERFEATATKADKERFEHLKSESAQYLQSVDVPLAVAHIQQEAERRTRKRSAQRDEVEQSRSAGFTPAGDRRSILRFFEGLRIHTRMLAVVAATASVLFIGLAIFTSRELGPNHGDGDGEDLRFKGLPLIFTVHIQRRGHVEELTPEQLVFPGDQMRFEIRAPNRGYVAVVAINDQPEATIYAPFDRDEPLLYDPQLPLLEGAIEVVKDRRESIEKERLFALFSEKSFSVRAAAQALAQSRPLPKAIQFTEISYQKATPPP